MMLHTIQIKPTIHHQSNCPYCQHPLTPKRTLWQGIHICVEHLPCSGCGVEILEDLRVGHAVNKPYQINLKQPQIFGREDAKDWLGIPLYHSLQNPEFGELKIIKEVKQLKDSDQVIILNCIDFLYGHSLLKLLNAQDHLKNAPDCALIVIIQKPFRWLVPEGVSEVWTVDIPLKKGQSYYPKLNEFIQQEIQRFNQVFVSCAYSHPSDFDISFFTGIAKHEFKTSEQLITFIWREDRPWCNAFLLRQLTRIRQFEMAIAIQNHKVQQLFQKIKKQLPLAQFVVAGLGQKTKFPNWIADYRVEKFDTITEKQTCQIYAESSLVIGVHGSNMLLPSGLAGMTIDLMPERRWGNFAQDILYQEADPRIAAYRYRYIPLKTDIDEIADLAASMILKRSHFYQQMQPQTPYNN